MNAVYRCFDGNGQCYEFRGDTEDSCRTLLTVARSCFPEAGIVDLCGVDYHGETRLSNDAEERDSDEEILAETEFLKRDEEFKMIPLVIPVQKTTTQMLKKLCEGLAEAQKERKEVETLPQVETEPQVEEEPKLEDCSAEVSLVEVPEHEEILKEEEKEEVPEEEEMRPIVEIKVITAREASRDFSTLFG